MPGDTDRSPGFLPRGSRSLRNVMQTRLPMALPYSVERPGLRPANNRNYKHTRHFVDGQHLRRLLLRLTFLLEHDFRHRRLLTLLAGLLFLFLHQDNGSSGRPRWPLTWLGRVRAGHEGHQPHQLTIAVQ